MNLINIDKQSNSGNIPLPVDSQRSPSPKIFVSNTNGMAKNRSTSGSRKAKLMKAKPVVVDSTHTSFDMLNRSDTQSSISQKQQQTTANNHPTITLTEAPGAGSAATAAATDQAKAQAPPHQPRDKLRPSMPGCNGSFDVPGRIGSAKSVVHTLFQNGFLNMDAKAGMAGSDITAADEIRSKETYCNMWVTAHSNTNLNAKSKSTSEVNLNNSGACAEAPRAKTEEELQREYLTNLLSQLESEQQQQQEHNNSRSDFLQVFLPFF